VCLLCVGVVVVVMVVQIADTRIIMQFAICHGTTFRPIPKFDVTRQKDCDVVVVVVVVDVVWPLDVCLSVSLPLGSLLPRTHKHTNTFMGTDTTGSKSTVNTGKLELLA